MKHSDKYKITIEDESHLTEVASGHFTKLALWGLGLAFLILSLFVSGLLISATPLRTLLPGYLKESQRSATEESLLRLDSLIEANEVNRKFLENYIRVTNIDRTPTDSVSASEAMQEYTSDSLMVPTRHEQNFVSQMEERERFNISVLAPLAADGVLFSPVTGGGVFLASSKETENPQIVVSADESVLCSADGTVIGLSHSGSKGYNLTVQHNRGFATCYFNTGTPLVKIGDKVNGGQALALPPIPDASGRRCFSVRMWHNGMALVPYEYVGLPKREQIPSPPYEAPRGK